MKDGIFTFYLMDSIDGICFTSEWFNFIVHKLLVLFNLLDLCDIDC